jgi:hypothetical protein
MIEENPQLRRPEFDLRLMMAFRILSTMMIYGSLKSIEKNTGYLRSTITVLGGFIYLPVSFELATDIPRIDRENVSMNLSTESITNLAFKLDEFRFPIDNDC